MRKPYYLESRDTWMVWLNGHQEKLGKGITEQEAYARFEELREFRGTLRPTSLVTVLFEAFLDDVQVNNAKATYDWYNNFLSSFAKRHGNLSLVEVAPFHVTEWANREFKNDSPSTRHGAMRAVQRPFNWAAEQNLIPHSPIAKLKKPTPNRREKIIPPKLWQEIMATEKAVCWRDFLTFMRETGCRVQEVRILEAVHFDEEHQRFILPPSQAKGKKVPRVIYTTETALEIVRRRVTEFPEGPIFRSTRGKPLTRNAIRCRFRRYGTGLCATLLRHTYVTEGLIAGVDSVSMAVLVGHSDPSMIAKHYQHLAENPQYMKQLAKRVRS